MYDSGSAMSGLSFLIPTKAGIARFRSAAIFEDPRILTIVHRLWM
jgi:hypothetical protein